MCSCLGYALISGGQRVLLIDGDPATDGLSLFLLGPKGMDQVATFTENNTFVGVLEFFKQNKTVNVDPRELHRRSDDDHGVTYTALISGRGLYGEASFMGQVVPDLDQPTFREAIHDLFDQLRHSGKYDYVLVDTRGGFAFESADICALADSFIVVTEPDVTSYYQDRNLVSRINDASRAIGSKALLRAMIVNKAVDVTPQQGVPFLDTLEVSFRRSLVDTFKIGYKDTYPIPVSLDVLMAYKVQRMPYIANPESPFCFATMAAFSDILQIVTSRWSVEQVDAWNKLVTRVSQAVASKQEKDEKEAAARETERSEVHRLIEENHAWELKSEASAKESAVAIASQRMQYEDRIASMEREMTQQSLLYQRDIGHSNRFWLIGIAVIVSILGIGWFTYRELGSNTGPRNDAPQTSNSTTSDQNNNPANASSTTGPIANSGSSATSISTSMYAVVLARGKILAPQAPGGPSVLWEAQKALKAGLNRTAIYQRSGNYYVVVVYDNELDAHNGLIEIRSLNSGQWAANGVIQDLNQWCPIFTQSDVQVTGKSTVPLVTCLKSGQVVGP